MKTKIKIILLASILSLGANAAVLTVNNSPAGGAQYAQINSAIAAANAGDTVYVNGNLAPYANAIISKSITLIGAGTFTKKQSLFPSMVGSISFIGGISNVTIRGFMITTGINGFGNGNISFVTITDNYFTGVALDYASIVNVHDIVVSNNVHTGGGYFTNVYNGAGCYNFLIENNLINGRIENFNIASSTIQNNTFYNCGNAFSNSTTAVSGIMIKNNIFYNSHPSNGTSGCIFLNNISFNSSGTYPSLGGSNIDNTDPQLINVGASGGYSESYNFNTQNTSPAKNAGTDGTDLGYYGGVMKVSVLGEPQNVPVVRQMDIENTNVLQGGNIDVKVRSTKAR